MSDPRYAKSINWYLMKWYSYSRWQANFENQYRNGLRTGPNTWDSRAVSTLSIRAIREKCPERLDVWHPQIRDER
ncbi:MAG: hypothetical protein JNK57_16185 [Planctomycetaceae bacterium]|nr:hypothetical protein [Planctomycetaceae bacterium]